MTDATELDLDAIRARWTPPKREGYQGPGADIAHSLALMQWSLSRGVESKTDVPALLAALDEARAEAAEADAVRRNMADLWLERRNEQKARAEAAESSLAAVRAERDALVEQIAMLAHLSKTWREAAGDDRDAESKTLRAVCAHLDDLTEAALATAPPDENPATTEGDRA